MKAKKFYWEYVYVEKYSGNFLIMIFESWWKKYQYRVLSNTPDKGFVERHRVSNYKSIINAMEGAKTFIDDTFGD